MSFLRSLTATGWLAVAVLALSLALLGWCTLDSRRKAAQAVGKADAGQTIAEGRTAAAGDASAIRDRADERTSEIDATVKDGTDAIRHAPDRASANAAALRSLCRIDPSRDARCRVLLADPAEVG
ncbi:hypothetical protein HNP32_003413 [Brevundimonas bullata]|uniref:Uncharacterized protein n=1 Tax=Brevundimonas bullata TaxID=13160 RepID=A0A7W7N4I9_9CAUL|nr:hypothetical protein [Brevundimonas bullata]MBB4799655.1 hypothetical protein [Brevundimonas bullata]MBB6384274.1 hypothetical protein [Brevundimonas bullata]